MAVDVSGLKDAIDELAIEKMFCCGEGLRGIGVAEAPFDQGNLATSLEADPPAGGGGQVRSAFRCGVDYGFFTNLSELHGHPLMAFEVDGELVFARTVHPSAPGWWDKTLESWSEVVGGCEG